MCRLRFFKCLILILISKNIAGKVTLPNCGKVLKSEERIVGGIETEHGIYPFMISLNYHPMGHVCGGAVINENLMVTNAHCFMFSTDPANYTVYVGLHKLPETDHWSVQKLDLSEIIIHPEYNDSYWTNDIAILRPSKPINIAGSKGYVNGICLPETTDDPTGTARVIGWGHTEENGTVSEVLRETDLDIVDRKTCNKAYADEENEDDMVIQPVHICAGTPGRDACQYDSGGPLFQISKEGVATLIGGVSFGNRCGIYPGVYTKTALYKKWIEKTNESWNIK